MILDKTFFYGDIFIPNLSEDAVSLNEVQLSLAKYEREAFHLLLGVELYDELITHLEFDAENKAWKIKDTSSEKWKKLWNGANFKCKCGCSKKWQGFITTDTVIYNCELREIKSSLLAYYAYYRWCGCNNTITAGTGEQKPKVKNSEYSQNISKQVGAWNYFVAQAKTLQCFCKCNFKNFCGVELNTQNQWNI